MDAWQEMEEVFAKRLEHCVEGSGLGQRPVVDLGLWLEPWGPRGVLAALEGVLRNRENADPGGWDWWTVRGVGKGGLEGLVDGRQKGPERFGLCLEGVVLEDLGRKERVGVEANVVRAARRVVSGKGVEERRLWQVLQDCGTGWDEREIGEVEDARKRMGQLDDGNGSGSDVLRAGSWCWAEVIVGVGVAMEGLSTRLKGSVCGRWDCMVAEVGVDRDFLWVEDLGEMFAEVVAPEERWQGRWRRMAALDVPLWEGMTRLRGKMEKAGVRLDGRTLRGVLGEAMRHAEGAMEGRLVDGLVIAGRAVREAVEEEGKRLAGSVAGAVSVGERLRKGAVREVLEQGWRIEKLERAGIANAGRKGMEGRKVLLRRSVIMRGLGGRWWRFESWDRGTGREHGGLVPGLSDLGKVLGDAVGASCPGGLGLKGRLEVERMLRNEGQGFGLRLPDDVAGAAVSELRQSVSRVTAV